MHSGPILLLVVFGATTLALAFGVPLMLLRERVSRPARFALACVLLYVAAASGTWALLARDVPSARAIATDLANEDITRDEYDAMVAKAGEAKARAARTGMGIGLMGAIGLTWIARVVAGRRLARKEPGDAALRRHIVGCACVVCSESISMELEGRHCAKCGVALHRRCAAIHRRAAHADRAPRIERSAKRKKKKPAPRSTKARVGVPALDLDLGRAQAS
jgi:hypothetical protein